MPLVRDVMIRRPVSVSPHDTVRTAMERLRAEQLDVLPVVADGAIVGSVDILSLFRLYGEMPVAEAVGPALPTIEPDAPLGAAAARMVEQRARSLVVICDGEPVGILTERDLADSWGSVPDPLTGLPWQDQLRRWASAHLRRGREVAVLFLDLNGFGAFNKEHGHVLADRVLQAVADALRSVAEPEQDIICRYGGDEFAVATTRPLVQARALAQAMRRAIAAVELQGEEVNVSAAIGIAGGQRAGQRPGSHAPATMDDLLNLASRASTHAKSTVEQCYAIHDAQPPAAGVPAGAAPARAGEIRTRLEGYELAQRGGEVKVTVSLRRGGEVREGSETRPADELREAAAAATAAALGGFLPPGLALTVTQVSPCAAPPEGEVLGAAVTLRYLDGPEERLFGAAPAVNDPCRGVIHAVLDATNRRLGFWLSHAPAPAPAVAEETPRRGRGV